MQQRTVFTFYAIIIEPFMILSIVYCAKLMLDSQLKSAVSQAIVAGLFTLVLLCFFPVAEIAKRTQDVAAK